MNQAEVLKFRILNQVFLNTTYSYNPFSEHSQLIRIPFQARISDWRQYMLQTKSRVLTLPPKGKLTDFSPATSHCADTVHYLRKTTTTY